VNNGHLLVAYHGCDISVRDALVTGELRHLDFSRNRYDWLGPGVYFFESDMHRAKRFAEASRDNPEKMYTARPIVEAAVVGAVLSVHHCLDMTTQEGLLEFSQAYPLMIRSMTAGNVELPVNQPTGPDDTDVLLRQLDNAVFKFIHDVRLDHGAADYQAVRGAFRQGEELAPNSGFHAQTHVQLALRDPACVLGWFLVPGDQLLSPRELSQAKARVERAVHGRKPRA
jgi:hypothetical protein